MTNKSFDRFLNALRAFESGIDPSRLEWYIQNYHTPVIRYPSVSKPGRVKRDWSTGKVVFAESITIQEYFQTLGVDTLFDKMKPNSLTLMQYHCVNPWGFIGYQIGESILISTGYYQPESSHFLKGDCRTCNDSYYFYMEDQSVWRYGNKQTLYEIPGGNKTIIATDTNQWRGEFTGKNNIFSLEDLTCPTKQEKVVIDILLYNANLIEGELSKNNLKLSSLQEKNSNANVQISRSGILAAAHLCGVYGVLDYLLTGNNHVDELGTAIISYMNRFHGYEIRLN